jgi:hypothetical protein
VVKESERLIGLVRDSIVATRNSLREITEVITGAVSTNLSNAMKETGEAHAAIAGVVRGAMEGVIAAGDDIGKAADATVVGVFRGIKNIRADSLDCLSTTATEVVRITAELRGDIAKAARGVVEGAIAAAKETGVNVEETASAAATAAHKAAGEISAPIGTKVRAAVTGMIAGVNVILKEPSKKSAKTS